MREARRFEAAPNTADQGSVLIQDREGARLSSPGRHTEIDLLADLADAEDRGQWSRAAQLRMWIVSGRLQRLRSQPAR